MSHETLVYGFIAGAGGRERHNLRDRNDQVISNLPLESEFPFLVRSMFSCPPEDCRQLTFRTPVIHFGGSMNGLNFDEVPKWIEKFEGLLARLYWHEAVAHIWTDYIDGCYQCWWNWDGGKEIVASYETENPLPTSKWIRDVQHLQRRLNAPPGKPFTSG